MAIRRAKRIARLYEECRGYDLVVVPEAPLAGALNRRLDRPHFGPFATTPRRLAAGRRERAEDRTAFLRVVETTDFPWKEAAYAVGNVLQCWEHRGSPDAIFEYEAFATDATRATVDCLSDFDTTSRRLAEHRIDPDADVAVVGVEQLTELERSILPPEYDTVDPFDGGAFDPPPFRVFDSNAAIVDALLESVTPENADRVAVVLDRGSEYSALVEAALEAASVPFYGGPGFSDDPHHRAFLRLLRTAHSGSDTRVGDVAPLLSTLGAAVDVEHDGKRLHEVDVSEVTWLTDFCDSVADRTFGDAVDEYEAAVGTGIDRFREELDRLGLLSEPITEPALCELEFYVQAYEVPVDRENEGVLLADAKSAAYVDRPAVFYLGLDEGWTHSSPRRPWVDRDREFDRHVTQFQLLIQNGVEQYYLVQDAIGGRPVTPCLYFEELLEREFERFSDLHCVEHARTFRLTGGGFVREPVDVTPRPVETISQSGLSTFVNCPRDYLFSRLVDAPDRDYFRVGNLFHDFAEFYVESPDLVDDEALSEIVELMIEETRAFDRDVDRATNRTRYRIGLQTIVEFLDSNPPEGADFLTPKSGWGHNVVAEHFDRAVEAPHTEWWFEHADLGLMGKVDLVHGPDHLLDYKSGKKQSAHQVVARSALSPPSDTPNFQALSYLAHHRTRRPDECLRFSFFHFLATVDDVVAGEGDLSDCLTTITYYPVPFEEHVATRAVFYALCEEAAGDCRKTFSQVGYADYVDVLSGHAFPATREGDELISSPLGRALVDRMRELVGEYAYVENGCAQALRHLRDVRDRNYFADDVDAFEVFVADRIEELNRYRAGEERFPVSGLSGEPNYRWVDNRDCILEDDD